jgi:hemerythrin-like domain-containing protein
MDAISLLKADHDKVEDLFKKFEEHTDRAHKTRESLVEKMIEELSIHAAIEEQLFYPAVRRAVPDADSEVLEGLEEHNIVKWTLAALEGLSAEDERFVARVTVLMENVRHHVEEEEGDLFPQIKKAMSSEALEELGEQLKDAKALAPTHPHPRSPDEPPFNLIAGMAAGVADKAVDKVRETADKAFSRS